MGLIKDIPRKCKQKQGRIRKINIKQKEMNRKKRDIFYVKGNNIKKEEPWTFTYQKSTTRQESKALSATVTKWPSHSLQGTWPLPLRVWQIWREKTLKKTKILQLRYNGSERTMALSSAQTTRGTPLFTPQKGWDQTQQSRKLLNQENGRMDKTKTKISDS